MSSQQSLPIAIDAILIFENVPACNSVYQCPECKFTGPYDDFDILGLTDEDFEMFRMFCPECSALLTQPENAS